MYGWQEGYAGTTNSGGVVVKIYPSNGTPQTGKRDGFTANEINQGLHWLHTDMKCKDCGRIQSVAQSGSTDMGRCGKCGGRMV